MQFRILELIVALLFKLYVERVVYVLMKNPEMKRKRR
jgi:hypothetical protein